METFSDLLAFCDGNPPFNGGFPSQRPVTRYFDGLFEKVIDIEVIWDVIALIITSL